MKRPRVSIITKLTLINLIILLAIGGIGAANIFSLREIEKAVMSVIDHDVKQVVDTAAIGRTLSDLSTDIQVMVSTFQERPTRLRLDRIRFGKVFQEALDNPLVVNSPKLHGPIQHLDQQVRNLLEQCAALVDIAASIQETHRLLEEGVTKLATLMSDTLLFPSLPNSHTVLEQISLYFNVFRQSGIRDESPNDAYIEQIVVLLEELEARLLTVTPPDTQADQEVSNLQEVIRQYKEQITTFRDAMQEFQSRFASFNDAQGHASVIITGSETEIVETTENTKGYISKAIQRAQEVTLSLFFAAGMFLLIGAFIGIRMIRPIKQLAVIACKMAKGETSEKFPTIKSRDELGELLLAMKHVMESIQHVLSETNRLIQAIENGQLETRGNADTMSGNWKTLMHDINNVIETFVTPLNVTAEYLDRLSKGDIPDQIQDEYRGDFNEIKNNLNTLIDSTYETTRVAEEIASGNLSVEARARSDEDRLMYALNQMIEAFLVPLNTTSRYVERLAKGDIPEKMTMEYKGDFNRIKKNLNALIDATHEVTHVSTSLAKGNLKVNVKERSQHDVLMRSLNVMLTHVKDVVKNVQEASNTIATQSQELSLNAEAMSQGASQQAAATEQVSSSMEQMSANIRQNADNTRETEQLALQSAEYAEESGRVVAETLVSIQQIAEKIMIIEEIATQTRLLSLNATIEASRAQEHGKAFSVVASEVRKLSDVTKRAAEEISQLASSTLEVSKEAGSMLSTLVPSIHKTSELVQEIAAANNEQSVGTEHINLAIQQLDQVTQQNAATTEELAAAAEQLTAQAQQLQSTVKFFRIEKTKSGTEKTPVQDNPRKKRKRRRRRKKRKPSQEAISDNETQLSNQQKEKTTSDNIDMDMAESDFATDVNDEEFERY